MSEGQRVPIVLVDDDPDEHFLFRADLEDAGVDFDFHAFTKADEALDHLRERAGQAALVLTDLSLAADGALKLIQEAADLIPSGAIGVYSGTRNPEAEQRCRDAGARFYIVKPVTRQKLEEVVIDAPGVHAEARADGSLHIVIKPTEL
ncbi:response regulator [Maricaulis sp.]|uniref:response regulator n=1 Tax=Maricaulis sp. TaxID=1486257 RepID=UPI002638B4F5|nr:response regulator [Maricaulis sp.]